MHNHHYALYVFAQLWNGSEHALFKVIIRSIRIRFIDGWLGDHQKSLFSLSDPLTGSRR